MTVGDRIKKRRIELGISQVELAQSCGASKQTIYKYENNIVTNIPFDNLTAIARKLDISASALMGWEEKEESPTEPQLSEGEKELIQLFQLVPKEDQPMVLRMIRAAINKLQ